jgi:hypothetical protein
MSKYTKLTNTRKTILSTLLPKIVMIFNLRGCWGEGGGLVVNIIQKEKIAGKLDCETIGRIISHGHYAASTKSIFISIDFEHRNTQSFKFFIMNL